MAGWSEHPFALRAAGTQLACRELRSDRSADHGGARDDDDLATCQAHHPACRVLATQPPQQAMMTPAQNNQVCGTNSSDVNDRGDLVTDGRGEILGDAGVFEQLVCAGEGHDNLRRCRHHWRHLRTLEEPAPRPGWTRSNGVSDGARVPRSPGRRPAWAGAGACGLGASSGGRHDGPRQAREAPAGVRTSSAHDGC